MFLADDARLMLDAVYTVWMRSLFGNRSSLLSNVISVEKAQNQTRYTVIIEFG